MNSFLLKSKSKSFKAGICDAFKKKEANIEKELHNDSTSGLQIDFRSNKERKEFIETLDSSSSILKFKNKVLQLYLFGEDMDQIKDLGYNWF